MTRAGGADDLYKESLRPLYTRDFFWGEWGHGIGVDTTETRRGDTQKLKPNLIHALIEGLPTPAEPLSASHHQHLPPAAPLTQPWPVEPFQIFSAATRQHPKQKGVELLLPWVVARGNNSTCNLDPGRKHIKYLTYKVMLGKTKRWKNPVTYLSSIPSGWIPSTLPCSHLSSWLSNPWEQSSLLSFFRLSHVDLRRNYLAQSDPTPSGSSLTSWYRPLAPLEASHNP